MNTEPETKEHHVPFTKFFIAIGVQLIAIVGIIALIFPGVFHGETSHPWMLLAWTGMLGLPLSLFEYFYHRYLLHSAILPFMASMHRAHSTHHGLTYVKAAVSPHEPAKLVPVKSEFPIEEDHQEESMMFPLWSLPIFVAVFMILLGIPLKLLMPGQPVLLALTFAVTLYLILYEVWHAVLHLPFERFWQPFLNARFTKGVARHMYSFHLMHHWRPSSNLAIVGFWGVAVWDYAFLTHRRPERIPLQGAEVSYYDAKLKKPLWPVALLDRWQGGLYRASRTTERFLARIFLRRSA
ncbi:MAG TPA: hypothetical protein VHE55_00390 [Fimbriimonadaceae bacterium]|nr:hypothetical protein [Fimbriimonadaceae bacterium]